MLKHQALFASESVCMWTTILGGQPCTPKHPSYSLLNSKGHLLHHSFLSSTPLSLSSKVQGYLWVVFSLPLKLPFLVLLVGSASFLLIFFSEFIDVPCPLPTRGSMWWVLVQKPKPAWHWKKPSCSLLMSFLFQSGDSSAGRRDANTSSTLRRGAPYRGLEILPRDLPNGQLSKRESYMQLKKLPWLTWIVLTQALKLHLIKFFLPEKWSSFM